MSYVPNPPMENWYAGVKLVTIPEAQRRLKALRYQEEQAAREDYNDHLRQLKEEAARPWKVEYFGSGQINVGRHGFRTPFLYVHGEKDLSPKMRQQQGADLAAFLNGGPLVGWLGLLLRTSPTFVRTTFGNTIAACGPSHDVTPPHLHWKELPCTEHLRVELIDDLLERVKSAKQEIA